MNHRRALLYLIFAAVFWSTGGVLIKTTSLHPLAIAGGRSLIAGSVLALFICYRRKIHFSWTFAQIAAGVSFMFTVVLFVCATKLTTAANAILLQYTAPVYVAILSGPMLGEKVRLRDWCSLLAVLVGLVVFFSEKISQNFLGDALALGSGVAFAFLTLFLRQQKGESTMESLLLGHGLAALCGLPYFFFGPLPSTSDFGRLTILGVVQLGVPYILYGLAIPWVSALEAILIPILEPILNPIWVALLYGESPSGRAIGGGAIVLTALLLKELPLTQFYSMMPWQRSRKNSP